jgi:hypothetical protein
LRGPLSLNDSIGQNGKNSSRLVCRKRGGKSAVHPPKRSTRRSEGRGWRCCAVSLRITATGRN